MNRQRDSTGYFFARRGGSSSLFFLLLFAFARFAYAEHEADHRYTVRGHVRDAAGVVRKGMTVVAEHKGGQKKSASTDGRGFYEIKFHLHDSNKGDDVTVTADGQSKTIQIDLTPGDHVTERVAQVDFGAPGQPDREWVLWMAGAGLIGGGGYYLQRIRKQKHREEKRETRRVDKKKKRG